MAEKKKRGGQPVDEPQNKGFLIKFTERELVESKEVARSEGYTFGGWVKKLIRNEQARIKRRK